MKEKNIKEVKSDEVIGMSKSVTVKIEDVFLKVNVWIQKSLKEGMEKEQLKEIESLLDEQIEESINSFKKTSTF